MSRRASRLALFLGTLVFAIGVGEIGLRIAWRRTKPPGEHSWHDHDDRLGWRHKKSFKVTVARSEAMPTIPAPFEVRLDAQGLRDDRDMAPEPSAGVFRIACVGDSYTFGFCIPGEAAWPKRLEAKLGAPYEAWNWGVCAYGLDQFVLALDEALSSSPRLVIVGVIDMSFRRATNSHFLDGTAKPRFHVERGKLIAPVDPVPVVNAGDSYCRFEVRGPSYVLAGLERVFENARVKLAKDPAEAAEDWQLGRALLLEAAKRCREKGVRFAVALLPEDRLMGTDKYARLLPTLEPDVAILDTYPAFLERRSQDPRPLFVPGDGHPNEAGSQLIAETIADLAQKRGLLAR